MRRIGTLTDPNRASQFRDYLLTESIDCVVDVSSSADGSSQRCDLWIKDETHVNFAREEFMTFQDAPDDAKFKVTADADRIRKEKVAEEKRRQSLQKKVNASSPSGTTVRGISLPGVRMRQQSIPVVIAVIALSIFFGLTTDFAQFRQSDYLREPSTALVVYEKMKLSNWMELWETQDPFVSVKRGEPWRLLTPMILHGSAFHLAFNMLALFFLGSVLEKLQGSLFLAGLLVFTHLVGIVFQVYLPPPSALPDWLSGIAGSYNPIGASGAVYGLFGYLWIRPIVSDDFPIQIPPSNIKLMLAWIPLCIFFIDGVANGSHIGGLIGGMIVAGAYAYLPTRKAA